MGAQLKTAIVGVRDISRLHADGINGSPELDLAALCDLNPELLDEKSESYGVSRSACYTDFAEMLEKEKPEVLAISTPNTAHANLTMQAAKAGVKGICCEKPMAIDPADAREMAKVCGDLGVHLIINHQRRTVADYIKAKELMDTGAIGDVYLIRGTCAGDFLSDATHLIDSIQYLTGDTMPLWVFSSMYRDIPDPSEEKAKGYFASGGWRYGHPIETGALATWEYEGGLRAETLTGDLRMPDRPYHDVEILGSKGRLWRSGDKDPAVLLKQAAGDQDWSEVDLGDLPSRAPAIIGNYSRLAEMVRSGGGYHPLSAEHALAGFEILTGIYESARTRSRVVPPVEQDTFPLQVMVDEGTYPA